jgi:hypothetical protein
MKNSKQINKINQFSLMQPSIYYILHNENSTVQYIPKTVNNELTKLNLNKNA